MTVLGTNGDDDITLIGTANNAFDVTINDGLPVSYANAGDVLLDGQNGDDDIDVDLNGFTLTGTLTVNGNEPSSGGGDTLTVAGADALWAASASDGGTLTVDTEAITVQQVESLIFDGEGTGTLTINGTASDDTFTHTPGSADDAGTVGISDGTSTLLGISYVDLGSSGTVTVDGLGGTGDMLVAVGTSSGDNFDVSTANQLYLNSRVLLATTSVENYQLQGLDGDDKFDLSPEAASNQVEIFGDSGSDLVYIDESYAFGSRTYTAGPDVSDMRDDSGLISITGGTSFYYKGVDLVQLFSDGDDTITVDDDGGDNVWTLERGPAVAVDTARVQLDSRTAIDVDFVR